MFFVVRVMLWCAIHLLFLIVNSLSCNKSIKQHSLLYWNVHYSCSLLLVFAFMSIYVICFWKHTMLQSIAKKKKDCWLLTYYCLSSSLTVDSWIHYCNATQIESGKNQRKPYNQCCTAHLFNKYFFTQSKFNSSFFNIETVIFCFIQRNMKTRICLYLCLCICVCVCLSVWDNLACSR